MHSQKGVFFSQRWGTPCCIGDYKNGGLGRTLARSGLQGALMRLGYGKVNARKRIPISSWADSMHNDTRSEILAPGPSMSELIIHTISWKIQITPRLRCGSINWNLCP